MGAILKEENDKSKEERQALKDELQELKDLIKLRREEMDEILKRKTVEDTALKENAQQNGGIHTEEKKDPILKKGPVLKDEVILKDDVILNDKPFVTEGRSIAGILTEHERPNLDEMRIEDLEETNGLSQKQNWV